jgi:SAM-dependent methyltransferase
LKATSSRRACTRPIGRRSTCSRGFIEHFADPSDAIARHFNLLKPGGLLIVSIPNLRGLNHICSWLFDRDVLAIHNLSIMNRRRFEALFAAKALERLHCGYFGTFNVRLFNAKGRFGRLLMRVSSPWQAPLNLAFRTLFGARSLETPWSSPNLIYVGRRTSG